MNRIFKFVIFPAFLCMGMFLIISCSTSRAPKTMRLFLQAKRPNILLPYGENSNSGILGEQVEFSSVTDTLAAVSPETTDSSDIWRTVHLDRVDVVAARTVIRQVTMRQGSVRLEFDVQVPGVLIDSCWRLVLTPVLSGVDSTDTSLRPVVLSGSDFIRMQEAHYKSYEQFLKGIIDPSAYDSIYLDRKSIARDIFRRQKFFYDLYDKERDRQLAYEKWKRLSLDRQNYWNMRVQANRTDLHHRLERKKIKESVRSYVAGRDTFGLSSRYSRKYRRIANFWPMYRMERKMSLAGVPARYQDLYSGGRSLSDIRNYVLSASDSTEISRHRYFFDRIAENEMNNRNRDLIRERMIPFPYIDSVMVRRTAVPGEDYIYSYTYSLPVKEGMKKLRLRLESIVEATDYSTWHPAPSDTLLFVVASLSDLVDYSLLQKFAIASSEPDSAFAMSDSLVSTPSYTPEGESYAEGLRFLQEREYHKALPLLQAYPDYNTALCLTSLGYHSEASALLQQLPRTANREYLYAVVCARMENALEAVEHLLDACRMNPDLILRIPLDPELSDLVPQFIGLRQELDKIASGE